MAARKKQESQEAVPLSNNIDVVAGRVKKDIVWVLVSLVIAVGAGLAVGSLFKF